MAARSFTVHDVLAGRASSPHVGAGTRGPASVAAFAGASGVELHAASITAARSEITSVPREKEKEKKPGTGTGTFTGRRPGWGSVIP